MKTTLACLILLAAATAPAQTLQDCYNGIGIFTVQEPDLAHLWDTAHYDGPLGLVPTYVVLINPFNEHTEEPIATLGGYEFRVEFPAGLTVIPHFPPGVGNFMSFPDVSVGNEIPITGRSCVLLTMDIAAFVLDPVEFYLTPVIGHPPAIPGEMVIADADDGLSISLAAPVSQDFLVPVFTMFHFEGGPYPGTAYWEDCRVVPTSSTSWSGIKAMYR